MVWKVRQKKVNFIIRAGGLFHQYYYQSNRNAIRLSGKVLTELRKIVPVIWVIENHNHHPVDTVINIFPKDISIFRHFTPLSISEPHFSEFL